MLPERGHLRPGMFVVGGDSHSPTGGAFGAYMFGVGATEMAGVLATGEIWLKVPETVMMEVTGALDYAEKHHPEYLEPCDDWDDGFPIGTWEAYARDVPPEGSS